MGLGLNNSLKYSLLMDSRNGWYYVQRIAICLTAILAIYNVQSMNSGAKGYALLFFLFHSSVFLITFISCSVFGNSVVEEKEQGVLPLIMMTGTSPFSYLSAKFSSKSGHMLFLLMILIPPTLFAVTMGGVNYIQIFSLFAYLVFWFLFCGSLCFWMSVLFSEKKEVVSISGPLIVIILILLQLSSPNKPRLRLKNEMQTLSSTTTAL